MPRIAKEKAHKDSTATIGFEAKLWLAADSRGEAEPKRSGDSQPQAARRANAVRQTAESNRSNNMDAAEPSGANRGERDSLRNAARRAHAGACGKQPARQGGPKGQRGSALQYFLTRFASTEGKNGGVAKCEVQRASVEVKTLRPFVIRNSSRDISRADIGKEHADTFRNVQHPDLRADAATRMSAKPEPRSHLPGLLRSERQLPANPSLNDSDWCRNQTVHA